MAAAPTILRRDEARAAALANIPEFLDGIRDIVDEGTNLLARVNQTVAASGNPRPLHLSLLLLFRHALELADALDELFRAGCFVPAGLQLRAIVEARMQMLYMLGLRMTTAANPLGPQDVDSVPRDAGGQPLAGRPLQEEQDRRGTAYRVMDIRRQFHKAESFDAAALGAWMQRVTGTAVLPGQVGSAPVQAGITAEAARVRAVLASPEFAAVDAEFTRVRGNKSYDPRWHELWNGPRTVGALARSVGLAFEYETLYAETSRTMHGTNVQAQIGRANALGNHSIAMFREGKDLDVPINAFVLHMIQIYQVVINELRPADHPLWSEWVRRWRPLIQTAQPAVPKAAPAT